MGSVKRTCVYVLIFLVLPVCTVCADGEPATAGSYTTDTAADADWKKDTSVKLEQTIKMLGVIKDELDQIDKEKKTAVASGKPVGNEADNWGQDVREKTNVMVRLWRKVRSAMAQDKGVVTPSSAGAGAEDWTENVEQNVDKMVTIGEKVQKVMASYTTQAAPGEEPSLKDKLDKTIKILDAVKEELNDAEYTTESK